MISTISALKHFNPRSGERSDCGIPFISSYKKISIHAPANGATCPLGRFIRFAIFQSTLRRTERRFSQSLTIPLINFNPRSGERSDLQLIKEYREFNISIHAPANGATLINMTVSRSGTFQSTLRRTERLIQAGESGLTIKISIHAPANGATSSSYDLFPELEISIHAPANGATFLLCPSVDKHTISIHAPANGATINAICCAEINIGISIHAPANGATLEKYQHLLL